MSDLLTPISDLFQTQLETSRRISDAVFSGTGKLDHAVMEAVHHAVDEHLRFAQAIGQARDPQTLSNLSSTYWVSKPSDVQTLQKNVVQIITEMQNEVGRSTQAYLDQLRSKTMHQVSPNAYASSAGFGQSGLNPFSTAVSAWESSMRGMSVIAEKVIATARAGTTRASSVAARSATAATLDAVSETERAIFDIGDATEDAGIESDTPLDNGPDTIRHQNGIKPPSEQKKSSQSRRK